MAPDPLQPLSLDELPDAIGLGAHEHVAIVGGGGKTTILHRLGRALPGRRLLTTTTKMGHDQHRGLPVLIDPDDTAVAAIDGAAMVWAAQEGEKAVGVEPEDCDRWFDLVDHIVIEADGSRRRSFKSPTHYEPVVPSRTTLVVIVAGADALGRVIAEGSHRPELVAARAGCDTADALTPRRAAAALLHPESYPRAVPPEARLAIVVTKVTGQRTEPVGELLTALDTGLANAFGHTTAGAATLLTVSDRGFNPPAADERRRRP